MQKSIFPSNNDQNNNQIDTNKPNKNKRNSLIREEDHKQESD